MTVFDRLVAIAELCAERPVRYWDSLARDSAAETAEALSSIASGLEEGTETEIRLAALAGALAEREPEDERLSAALLGLKDMVTAEMPAEDRALSERYAVAVRRYADRVRDSRTLADRRAKLAERSDAAALTARDRKLFEEEGMMYCLEYYLMLYKTLIDLSDAEAKRRFIEKPMVNLGFGDAPGIENDFRQDEVLTKFLDRIVDDSYRLPLTDAYYEAKSAVLHAERVEDVERAMKRFLSALLEAFRGIGIGNLRSDFFHPYGENPSIAGVIQAL